MEIQNYFLPGLFVSFLGTMLCLYGFPKMGLLDFPERYGLKRARLPYPGGLVFWILGFGIMTIDPSFHILFMPLFVLGVMSFIDDRKNLSALFRLFTQLGMATALFYAGIRIHFIGNPFDIFCENCPANFDLGHLPIWSFLITILWIVAIQNAMNFFDGLKGLAVGVSGIGFLTLGVLGLVRPELFLDPNHASLTQANFFLAGLCVGGFWFFWKGKIILGDTGSQILGFLLATMSIFSGAKIATTLLVLGVPILDAGFVIFRRVFLEKKSPFNGDFKHLHHNLARIISEKKAVLLLMCFSAIFGVIALFLERFEKLLALVFVTILIFLLALWAARHKSNKSPEN